MKVINECLYPFNEVDYRVKFIVHEGNHIEIIKIYGIETIEKHDLNSLLVSLYTSRRLIEILKSNEETKES